MQPYGVIDLGTNTFHLLIAGFDPNGRLREVYRERRFVKLGEAGIETIGEAPFQRGLATLSDYHGLLARYGVTRIRAIGTAALRTASNGADFIRRVQEKTGIIVELISGKEEARLIYLGVKRAVTATDQQLIVDIGGGSVEFIIAGTEGVHWAGSFPVGMSVLFRRFHHQDPMGAQEIKDARSFLREKLVPLWDALRRFPVKVIVGAAGTFEVLASHMADGRPSHASTRLNLAAFPPLYEQVMGSTLEDRLRSEDLPAERADLIVVSLLLIEFLLAQTQVREVLVSEYALKEGILYEMRGAN